MEEIYKSVDKILGKIDKLHDEIERGGREASKEDVMSAAFLTVRVNELAVAVANLNGSLVIRALSETRPPGEERDAAAPMGWNCAHCTTENDASAESCVVCLSLRAGTTSAGKQKRVSHSAEEPIAALKSPSFDDEPTVASQINRIPEPEPLPEAPSPPLPMATAPRQASVPDLLPGLDISGADVFADPFDPFNNSLLKPKQSSAPEREKPLTRENSPSDHLGRTEPETEQPVEHIDPFDPGFDVRTPYGHSSRIDIPTEGQPTPTSMQPQTPMPTSSAGTPPPPGSKSLPQEEIDKRLEQWAKDGSQPRPIRSLLSKLDSVLPPALGFEAHPHFTKWKSPSLGDMLTGQQVRSVQREARLLLAPDKVRSKLDKEQGDVCEFLYQTINAAFVTFRQEELQT